MNRFLVFLAIIILILRNLVEHYGKEVVIEDISTDDKNSDTPCSTPNLKVGDLNVGISS